jgi:hypothetical protein
MKIIEDIGLTGFMGRVAGGSVCSQADALPVEEPLLIFAHKTNGATAKLSRHAGLQILERVIATCIPHSCRAMVIGFLPIRDYGEYQYLLDSRNYRQLPVDLKALAECEIPTTSEAASRRALQRQIAFAPRKLPATYRGWDAELSLNLLEQLLVPSGLERASQIMHGTPKRPLASPDLHFEIDLDSYLRVTGLLNDCGDEYERVLRCFAQVERAVENVATEENYYLAVAELRGALFALCERNAAHIDQTYASN